ncbi:hypothetical protein JG688_00008697 [Phytophthora aleatoria]|uniref:PexRD2 WYL domain-containing protein n=1 Tax=Phytophthora aleatoria TaxID=2496075 RepID=A0A8J5MG43_9STRA|nr:hypothetical protein JG688_00008697 [Phytophthora aleatoria]
MRLSQLFVVTMATILVSSDALVTSPSPYQASTSAMGALPRDVSQRRLRSHDTTDEDEKDFEERGLEKMKRMWEAGTSADQYAMKLGIADDIVSAQHSATALGNLMRTREYKKYAAYLSFLAQKNKKKRPDLIYYS